MVGFVTNHFASNQSNPKVQRSRLSAEKSTDTSTDTNTETSIETSTDTSINTSTKTSFETSTETSNETRSALDKPRTSNRQIDEAKGETYFGRQSVVSASNATTMA